MAGQSLQVSEQHSQAEQEAQALGPLEGTATAQRQRSVALARSDLLDSLVVDILQAAHTRHGHFEVGDVAVVEAVAPAVQSHLLAAGPGILHHGGLGHI